MDKFESLAQDMVEAGSEHFQIALHPDRVLFWVTGTDGACELMSRNWSELTGQPPDQALGSGWLRRVAPGDRQRVTEAVRAAVSGQRGFFLRYQVMGHDGQLSYVLHDAAARVLPSGQFNGLIATITGESGIPAGEEDAVRPAREVYEFLDNVPLAACSVDFSGCVAHANRAMSEQLGCALEELVGTDWIGRFVSAGDRALVRSLFNGSTALSALPSEIEYQVDTCDGTKLYRWHLTLIRDAGGHPLSLAMMGSDITRWRVLGAYQRLTAQMFENSNEAMVITDQDNRIISVNASFTRLTGYSREEAIKQNPRILQSGKHDSEFYRQMWHSLATLGYWRGDIWDRRKDGSFYPKFLAITVIRDEHGAITNYSAIFYDITERKSLEEQLDHLAHYDELTGLPNRTLLQDRLEQAIAGAERQKQHFALLFIDLDGFKLVNDTLSHAAGDKLLQQVARRLLAEIRSMDTAARLGGDEFVVILTDVKQRENVALVAEKILESLSVPYDLGALSDGRVSVSASIGVSIYPNDELVAHELLRSADEALYRAKREGKRQVVFFGNVG
jgi:diguanylate cyclase (GGDEF)-like protein/PAS domain S-box-containing protein